jgi:CDP-diacylglycerol--glycerol-3-phosphate 3-phosphatidyltransferase
MANEPPAAAYAVRAPATPTSGGPLSAAALAALALGIVAAGVVILALATARGATAVPAYGEYLHGWRAVHGLEDDRMVGGFVEWYLRLPYAVARPLARRGVSPDVVTLLGLVVAAASLPAYLAGGSWLALGGAAALVSGLCDQLDGAVAVLQRRTSIFGAIWDSVVDRLSDLALLVGPAAWLLRDVRPGTASRGVAGLVAAGAALFLLEYVRARSQAVGHLAAQVVTPAERPTRVVVAALLGVLCGALLATADDSSTAGLVWTWGAWGLAGLTIVSAGQLLLDARRRADPTTPTTAGSA